MNASKLPSLLLVACLFACPSDDTSSPTASGGDGGSTTEAATTGDSDAEAGDASASGGPTATTSTGADSTTGPGSSDDETGDASTGERCAPGRDPAGHAEVDGCDAPVGTPFCSEGQDHVPQDTEVAWVSNPPHSGPHYPTWLTWTEYPEPAPRGNWVHNLEHGGVVLLYHCENGCDAEVEVLREVMTARPDLRIILTPDPELEGERFAAVSWTWVYRFDTPDPDTLLCFVDQHEGHAPEDIP